MRLNIRTVVVLLAGVSCITLPLAAQTAKPVDADPAFSQKVRQTLLLHPEYIVDAMQMAQMHAHEAQVAEQNAKVESERSTVLASGFAPVVGNPKGTVVVAELLDYACPFCKRARDTVDKIVAGNPNVRVNIIMRPVLGPQSETMARFALAAMLQNKFAQTHEALYDKFGDDHQTQTNDTTLREVAQKAGLDFDKAKRDMTSDAVEKMLQAHKAAADKMVVNGTPFFVTSKTVINGAPRDEEQLKTAMGL